MWEESRDFNKAIDRYLEITENMFSADQLEEIWMQCFNLAMSYCKDRIQDVVLTIGTRMLKIRKFDSAAEVYEAVGYYEKAIEAYLQCQKFDRAMDCARQVRPPEMQNMLVTKIQE